MIEFKKVCDNFNIISANLQKPTEDIFLNSSLEIVRDAVQKASFEEVVSALQERRWTVSTETPEEVQKKIKKIWQQTKLIYPNCASKSILDLYQTSIFEKTLYDLSKLDEYACKIREQCESLSIYKCISSLKNTLSQPLAEELIQPILENFNQEIEQKYQQAMVLQSTDEFQLLKEWREHRIDQFFSVFIEEHDGKMEQSFPELLKLYEITNMISTKKRHSKQSTHSYAKISKKFREEITPKKLRERLLKIKQRVPIEISTLDKLKFIFRKNSVLTGLNFKTCYKFIKQFNHDIDQLSLVKKPVHDLKDAFAQLSKTIMQCAPEISGLIPILKGNIRNKAGDKAMVDSLTQTRYAIKMNFSSNPLLVEIALIKIKESDFCNRELECAFFQSLIAPFSQQSETNLESSQNTYRSLLQELDKIQLKQPDEKTQNLYRISEDTQEFFRLVGKHVTQIFTLEEYTQLDVPVLQPIFSQEEVGSIKKCLQQLQMYEDIHYEQTIASMLQSKLELQELEESKCVVKSHNKSKRKNNTSSKQKSSIAQKSIPPSNSKNWQEFIPIKTQDKPSLLYPTHVTRWFEDPKSSLRDPKYTAIIKKLGKDACLYFHSFPKVIDELVGTEYSLQNEIDNERTGQRDILYGIPGEIEIKGRKYRGFFQYIIDSKSGTCYHRCFNHRSKNFMEDLIQERVWHPNDFPTLDQSKDYMGQKMESFISGETTLQYDSILQKIHVTTEQMNIILFKSFDSDLVDEFFELIDK